MRRLRRRAGIHNPRSWLWIPGSFAPPRNDGRLRVRYKPPLWRGMFMTILANAARSLGALLIASAAVVMSPGAHAETALKAKVGVLRLSSSAPVFIAQDKGYFKEAGLDIELKFFDAAQPIAVAVTSGDVDFGVTAFTAGLYNLAGKGTLKVIGGMSREKPGYPLIGYFASNNAYAAGV